MEWLSDPNAWIALASLTALEIVLGIDNIVFISVLAQKLPLEHQARVRTLGLALAMAGRIVLLLGISRVMGLTKELFSIGGLALSGKDLILVFGGSSCWPRAPVRSTTQWRARSRRVEGHGDRPERPHPDRDPRRRVLPRLGHHRGRHGRVRKRDDRAVVIAVSVMLLAAGRVSAFIAKHPTVKMLALAFLILVGVTLLADGLHFHVPKGYIYFAMGFSLFVEFLNLAPLPGARRRRPGSPRTEPSQEARRSGAEGDRERVAEVAPRAARRVPVPELEEPGLARLDRPAARAAVRSTVTPS